MKTIQTVDTITLKVSESELIEGKWLNYQLLSRKLGEVEQTKGMAYKALRNKLYNSINCHKYNMKEIAGLKCFDIDNPMCGMASLVLVFERVK